MGRRGARRRCRPGGRRRYAAVVELGEVQQDKNGLWWSSVWPGRADVLLAALDPDCAYALIETWDGDRDWHEAVVSVGVGEEPRTRVVRHHRFDVLVSPKEATAIGRHLHAQGLAGGGFGCYQFRHRPRASFRLPDDPQGRADAMRGQGVELAIDLPHNGEVAVVRSPSKAALSDYMRRLA